MRRALVLLAAMLSAGCIAPEGGETAGPDLLGYCPQWVDGRSPHRFTVNLEGNQSVADNASAEPRFSNHPLDVYRVHIDRLELSGGLLEAKAYLGGDRGRTRDWSDYRQQPYRQVPTLAFEPGGNETGRDFDIVVADVKATDPQPAGPIELVWELVPDVPGGGRASVDYTVTFRYRVCGLAG